MQENVQIVPLSLKGRYHESVTNLTYAVISLTTVRQERCYAISERYP